MSNLILTFDGGGVLGIGPATFLRRWGCDYPNLKIDPQAVAGTSVGSILAAARAIGFNGGQIEILFRGNIKTIFNSPPWTWKIDPRKPKYDGTGLVKALKSVFGDLRMNQTKLPLFIVATDCKRGCPKVFDSTDECYIWEAVAASCSAPTYFPPRPGGLVDGGLLANNPTMVAITGSVAKLGMPLDSIWALSFGTNGNYWKDPKVDQNTSKLGWAQVLLESPTRGNEKLASFQASTLLGRRLLRIEPILERDYGLDNVSIIDPYAQLWQAFYSMKKYEVELFLERMGGKEDVT